MEFGFYNMDCMEGMKEIPNGFIDLAIVDPPYIFLRRELKSWKVGEVNDKDRD